MVQRTKRFEAELPLVLAGANAERGDNGGPCFREEAGHRRLMGIVLHRKPATGIKTTCLDLVQYKDRLEELIRQARASTN